MKDNTLRDTKCKDLVLNMLLKFGISMYRKIQEFIIYLLLGLLLSIVVSSSFGQQNQNTLQQEVEALQKRVSELEDKLQTVENVEKMELATKLAEAEAKHAEAYAKLIDTEFDKLKLELKDSNEKSYSGTKTHFGILFTKGFLELFKILFSTCLFSGSPENGLINTENRKCCRKNG